MQKLCTCAVRQSPCQSVCKLLTPSNQPGVNIIFQVLFLAEQKTIFVGFFTCSEFTLAISVLTRIQFFHSNESFLPPSLVAKGGKMRKPIIFCKSSFPSYGSNEHTSLFALLKAGPSWINKAALHAKRKKERCEVNACKKPKKMHNSTVQAKERSALFNFVN